MSARQFPPVSSEKCVTEKMDSNRDRIAFVFLSSANILGVGRLGFTSLFFFFYSLFSFFLTAHRSKLSYWKKSYTCSLSQESFPRAAALSVFMVR